MTCNTLYCVLLCAIMIGCSHHSIFLILLWDFLDFIFIAFPSALKPKNFFIFFVHFESPLFERELQTFTSGFKCEGPLTSASGGYKLHG